MKEFYITVWSADGKRSYRIKGPVKRTRLHDQLSYAQLVRGKI